MRARAALPIFVDVEICTGYCALRMELFSSLIGQNWMRPHTVRERVILLPT